MRGRKLARLPYLFALVIGLGLSSMSEAKAQSPTQDVYACLDGAADAFKSCVDDLPWYAEALCYARYASDGILCAPSVVFGAF
ncbi:MAG: hypothetical protein JNL44_02300 [Gemmatimonadetes bacterium]|nr:hypothetical protein [Gemmatimonadota bacterium]